jgi:NAD(P)-dependent dehydrogenase (short-subunit alcohol dehydrogenase family)
MSKPVIFITGSARGIGQATAKLAKERGYQPVLHGRTNSDHLQSLAEELGTKGYSAEISDKQQISRVIETAYKDFGRIDALVNCAGTVIPKPFLEMEPEDWQTEYEVNVLGTAYACQSVIPIMLEQESGGRIVNISSIRGVSPAASNRGMCYSMTKAAIANFTEALAKEYAPKINVNAVAPGFTATDMSETWNDTVWNQVKTALLKRAGDPEELAEAILFLASKQSSFITGQTILVDGGYTIAGK